MIDLIDDHSDIVSEICKYHLNRILSQFCISRMRFITSHNHHNFTICSSDIVSEIYKYHLNGILSQFCISCMRFITSHNHPNFTICISRIL